MSAWLTDARRGEQVRKAFPSWIRAYLTWCLEKRRLAHGVPMRITTRTIGRESSINSTSLRFMGNGWGRKYKGISFSWFMGSRELRVYNNLLCGGIQPGRNRTAPEIMTATKEFLESAEITNISAV